jgi:hypothetical protein
MSTAVKTAKFYVCIKPPNIIDNALHTDHCLSSSTCVQRTEHGRETVEQAMYSQPSADWQNPTKIARWTETKNPSLVQLNLKWEKAADIKLARH